MNLLLKGALLCSQAMCPWLFMLFIMHLYLHIIQSTHTYRTTIYIHVIFATQDNYHCIGPLHVMSCLTAVFWYLPWGNKPCIVVPHELRFRLVGPMYMRRSLPLEPVERLGWFGFERCNEDDMETVISYKSWGRLLLGLEQKMVSDKTLRSISDCDRVMTYCNILHKSMYLLKRVFTRSFTAMVRTHVRVFNVFLLHDSGLLLGEFWSVSTKCKELSD